MKRTRSEAITSDNGPPRDDSDGDMMAGLRMRSGDPITLANTYSNGEVLDRRGVACDREDGASVTQAIGNMAPVFMGVAQVGVTRNSGTKLDGIDSVFEGEKSHREADHFGVQGNRDNLTSASSGISEDTSVTDSHAREAYGWEKDGFSSSQEYHSDFCLLSYAESADMDIDTAGEYVIFDETDILLLDEDVVDGSMEVKDLAPADPMLPNKEKVTESVGRKRSASGSPPKANAALLQVFQLRIESIIVNSVTFPPGLHFVQ